jgi:formyl-CoA transferase
MGAEVIKIERPGRGDDTRGWGPPFLDSVDSEDRFSAYFLSCNRGKHSIAIDLSQSEGSALVRELVAEADMLVENFKPGTLVRYGLDYEQLHEINPRLIYLSITGYGQDGPNAQRPGYDYVFQGFGGLMSYTGKPDQEPGGGPVRVGTSIIDLSTGMYGTVAVLAALHQRGQTGTGQHIDLALSDVAVAMNANQNLNYLVSGQSPARRGNTHPNLAPYEIFDCRDGQLILAIGNDSQFAQFCWLADAPAVAEDPRFVTNEGRLEHIEPLRDVVAGLMRQKTRDEWARLFDKNNISWGPVNTVEQALDDSQTRYRRMQQALKHSAAGWIPTIRNPVCLMDISAWPAPPLLGENTTEVLSRFGHGPEDIQALIDRKVVGQS